MPARTILYVNGFHPNTRARDLAWEFERYGRLVRCDIPATSAPNKDPYSFIEFRHERDAEDAYYYMHKKKIDGYVISVQWAKKTPARDWRYEQADGHHIRYRRTNQREDHGALTREQRRDVYKAERQPRSSHRRSESPGPVRHDRSRSRDERESRSHARSRSPTHGHNGASTSQRLSQSQAGGRKASRSPVPEQDDSR